MSDPIVTVEGDNYLACLLTTIERQAPIVEAACAYLEEYNQCPVSTWLVSRERLRAAVHKWKALEGQGEEPDES